MGKYYVSFTTDRNFVKIIDTTDLTEEMISREDFEAFRDVESNNDKLLNARKGFNTGEGIVDPLIRLKDGYIYRHKLRLEIVYGQNRLKIYSINGGHLGIDFGDGIYRVIYNPMHYLSGTSRSYSLQLNSLIVSGSKIEIGFKDYSYWLIIDYATSEIKISGAKYMSTDTFIDKCLEKRLYGVLSPVNFVKQEFFSSIVNRDMVLKIIKGYWLSDNYIMTHSLDLQQFAWLIDTFDIPEYRSLVGKTLFKLGS